MLPFFDKFFKKQKPTTVSTPKVEPSSSLLDQMETTKMMVLDEVEQIVAEHFMYFSRKDDIIYVLNDVDQQYPVVSISLVPEIFPAIRFNVIVAKNIPPIDETFYSLIDLNVNEHKYCYGWNRDSIVIDYVMDHTTKYVAFKREVLDNVHKMNRAAKCIADMFSPVEIKQLRPSHICRFNEPSNDELFKEQVAAILDILQLKYKWYEESELCYSKHFLIEPTAAMLADDISVFVRKIDSNEYGVTIKTKVPIGEVELKQLNLFYTVNAIAAYLLPRYKLLRDGKNVTISYTVSLDCFDNKQLQKMCADICRAKDLVYLKLNELTLQSRN